jgi:hypothetical protein
LTLLPAYRDGFWKEFVLQSGGTTTFNYTYRYWCF